MFHEDVPIVLGNGEPFHFRPPRIVQYPMFDGGQVILTATVNYGREFVERHEQALIDEVERNSDKMLEHMFYFADMMLMRNYREEVRGYYSLLLGINPNEKDTIRRLMQIWDLARGYDPKGLASDGTPIPSGSTA